MSIRPGRAKGPFVGGDATGTTLTTVPGQGIIDETIGGNTQVSALAGFHDFFEYATLKPFWQNTQVITSADWQLDAGNDTLDGIAENNAYNDFRLPVEGDLDYAMKIDRNGATTCGFRLRNEAASATAEIRKTATQVLLVVTGYSNITVSNTDDTLWLRIVRYKNDWYAYYKVADADAWTLVGTRNLDTGDYTVAQLISANGAEIHEVHFYDNTFPERVMADASKEIALTEAATINLDASAGNTFTVTLTGNRTMGAPSNPTRNQKIIFRITQDGTGSRTLTWNAIYRFSTDIPSPTLSTGAGDIDYIGFIYNQQDTKWDCIALVQGF